MKTTVHKPKFIPRVHWTIISENLSRLKLIFNSISNPGMSVYVFVRSVPCNTMLVFNYFLFTDSNIVHNRGKTIWEILALSATFMVSKQL